MFDPDKNSGFVQMFRRAENTEPEMRVKLYGLDAEMEYELKDYDRGVRRISGKVLMEEGYTVRIENSRGSALIRIIGRD